MRDHSTPPAGDNGHTQRNRTRGAIRTHLGRKRTGPRNRLKDNGYDRGGRLSGPERHRLEDLFDRMSTSFQEVFARAGERSVEAFESALETAFEGLVAAGEFTAESGTKLRDYVRRDLLHRENPALTFRTGDITTAGTLTCVSCGWTIITQRSTVLPPCPHCGDTAYRKTG
jgi:zinc ribbon family protein